MRAVQTIPGRYEEPSTDADGKSSPGYQPFELNLVFADGSRWNASNHADLAWTRETAREVAGFLDVPHLDRT